MPNKNIPILLILIVSNFVAKAQFELNTFNIESTDSSTLFQEKKLELLHYFNPIIKDSAQDEKKSKYKVDISGVIQVHYNAEFNTNGDTIQDPDGFRILRARLIAKGKINKYLGYELMIDPRSPELGGVLRDAFVTIDILKNQTIQVGKQKTQFGWENRVSITKLYTVNRAEMSDGVSRGENLRDIGIGLIGHVPINKNFQIENAITFTNGTRGDVTGPYDFNTAMALWGRVGIQYETQSIKIDVGGSFAGGGLRYLGDTIETPSDDVYASIKRIGADIQIDHKLFYFATEIAQGTDIVADTIYEEPFGYQLLLALKTKWDIGPVVRYDVFEDEWKRTTIGAYYGKPKDPFRMLINYDFRGMILDQPGGHDDRLYIQMQLTF